jgi:hypothetical protein
MMLSVVVRMHDLLRMILEEAVYHRDISCFRIIKGLPPLGLILVAHTSRQPTYPY